jgi:hypothetical protein
MLQAPWITAAAAAIHLLGDVAGTFDLSNRAEVRGRTTQSTPSYGGPNPSLDLADTPSLRLNLSTRSWEGTLGYSAMILVPDAEVGITPTLIQSGDVGTTWHERQVTLGVAEYVVYGSINSATTGPLGTPTTGAAPPPASVTALVQPGTIQFGSSRSVLRAVDRLSRRWTLSLSMEYLLTGGLDASSQASMPLVYGPRGELIAAYVLSRRDRLESRILAQRVDTSSGVCSPFIPASLIPDPSQPCDSSGQIGQATEVWVHELSTTTQMSLGAGAAGTQMRYQDAQAKPDEALFPVGLAAVQYTHPITPTTSSTFRLDLTAAPFVDLRTGVVDERAQATGAAQFHARSMVYSGTLGATRSIDSPFILPLTSFQALLEAEYIVSPIVGVGGGVRYAWQDQEPLGIFSVAMVFAQVTLHAPLEQF